MNKNKMSVIRRLLARTERVEAAKHIPQRDLSQWTPAQKLDEVLRYMKTVKDPPFQLLSDIQLGLKEKGISFGKHSDELWRILMKLVKDGYIHAEPNEQGKDIMRYYLSFEGEALLELEGGYSGRLVRENREKISAQSNERNTRYGVVGAAIFAGCLLVWDILKFLYDKNQILSYVALYLLVILAYNLIRKVS